MKRPTDPVVAPEVNVREGGARKYAGVGGRRRVPTPVGVRGRVQTGADGCARAQSGADDRERAPTPVGVRGRAQTGADGRERAQTPVGVCGRAQTGVNARRRVQTGADGCARASTAVYVRTRTSPVSCTRERPHARATARRRPPASGGTLIIGARRRRHMPVTRLELTGIEAKRFSRVNEKHNAIRIDHNSSVVMVKELSAQEASVEFRYTATYGPIGHIRIDGTMVFQCDAKAFEEQWRTTSQMSPEVATEIHSTVMRVCVPQAVGVAKDLQLPPPIPLPQVQFQQQPKPGVAHIPGPEVM